MTALRVALLPIVLYLSLDFANPHLPGAMSFEVNRCVEGVRVERPRVSVERFAVTLVLTSRAIDLPADEKTPNRRIVAADPTRLGVVLARDPRRIPPDPPSPADDH
ncbi:MAG: hypothetical protein HYU25_14065 [Candidatus Rokubacteria bacterium]|nr:hypothetical protein [Candidatus Rokubacteria bacterium]